MWFSGVALSGCGEKSSPERHVLLCEPMFSLPGSSRGLNKEKLPGNRKRQKQRYQRTMQTGKHETGGMSAEFIGDENSAQCCGVRTGHHRAQQRVYLLSGSLRLAGALHDLDGLMELTMVLNRASMMSAPTRTNTAYVTIRMMRSSAVSFAKTTCSSQGQEVIGVVQVNCTAEEQESA